MNYFYCLVTLLLLQMNTLVHAQQSGNYKTVEEKEFSELSKKQNVVVLDVRTPEEYKEGHLDKAVLMNYNSNTFQQEVNKLDKSKTYLVYCKAGGRSARASAELAKKGLVVYNLDGGISNWKGKILK
ncbi:MAG TPA: rhodanese-like domain-containing protein [Cytophagaceae bacterium]|jgi:rhodanese-related sulfurtransferase|nr:rhodanese-like domain-containing protein [Cytophagaceae bacterium]